MCAFRHFLACSRPRNHHGSSTSKDHAATAAVPIHLDAVAASDRDPLLHQAPGRDPDRQMIAELHAILRHLEVRWQLFNESLSKFRDLEAMLANCTDDVTWSTANGDIIRGKNHLLLALLQSLITRKLSLEVDIKRITRVTSSGSLDLTLDESGHCGCLTGTELFKAATALDLVLPTGAQTYLAASACEGRPLMILEKDTYTLRNAEGYIVEAGTREVLWEQHNSTWYIRGYLSYSDEPLPPMHLNL